ncbi:ABC transporter substrate-binding protein [Sphaerochaeta halotolerans]|uniref:ABC transporter substrate-binding protein n=1 Tax=Sphaerochaeta halotolerans TaxID=2293840 RepID=UPI00136C2A12|nr:sugar ABC transporter substrate-binding protein [Sphaerochaeta halotolerans]MXI85809.1 extracellular solute-binding protein [Sphaerochaeta halotolerans]
MKRLLLFVVLITCMIGMVFAAGGKEQAAPADGTELSFWTFQDLHMSFYEKMSKLWNEENPERKIIFKPEVLPFEDMHTKLLVSLQAGTGAPDLVDIEIGKYPNFLKGDVQLIPLNDVIDPVRDKFVTARLDIYSKDGQNYGLPFHVGASVIFYNMEILDAAGIDPYDIKTWDDYMEAGKIVKQKTGKPMATVEVNGQWSFWPMIAQQGSDFLDADGNVILDNATNVKTLQYLKDLLNSGVAVAAPGGNHHAEEYYGFMNDGGAASMWMPMWYMNRFTDYMPDLAGKILILPMPRWTSDGARSAGMGGTGTSVTNQARDIELAKDFLMFAKGSEEGNLVIWEDLGFDPPRWDVWDNPRMNAPNKFTDYYLNDDIFGMLLEIKDEINSVNVKEKLPAVIDRINSSVMIQALQQQTKSPAEALREAAELVR